ncbi:MAG: glycosyltransferase family 4 protein [Candidatus Hydrothermarchaeales archaeon]
MKALKISQFSWESIYSVRTGGLAQAVTELAETLARKGHEVHIFTRMGEGQRDRDEVNGVHYHRCAFDPGTNIMEYAENMCRAMVHSFSQIEEDEGRFDVIHGHDWHVVNALNEIKDSYGYPIFLSYHSTEYGRNGGFFGDWWEYREISGREWYGGLISDRIITVSHTMKDELMWLYDIPDWKIDVIPNGIHAERYRRNVDPGRVKERYGIHPLAPVILFIGRLVQQKGPDLLIEAIPHVLAHRWDAKFVIAGEGGLRGQLEHRASELGVSHAVRFLGYIPDEEYLDILNACDIVCIPSRNEPFGIVLLEAWGAGKPVIATDIGGPSENITNFKDGIKVNHRPESIAWGINYIIDDAEGVKMMGKEGRKVAQTLFNWNYIARKTIESYERL